jgi:Cu(I)/Ag(I) efflux system membrane fusion protein
MTEATNTGVESDNIESARDAFYHLSVAAIELHDTFGHAGDASFYLTYCPMARDNTGAHWLQTENIVWNSFYGDMMLRCGTIKDELPSTAGSTQ